MSLASIISCTSVLVCTFSGFNLCADQSGTIEEGNNNLSSMLECIKRPNRLSLLAKGSSLREKGLYHSKFCKGIFSYSYNLQKSYVGLLHQTASFRQGDKSMYSFIED